MILINKINIEVLTDIQKVLNITEQPIRSIFNKKVKYNDTYLSIKAPLEMDYLPIEDKFFNLLDIYPDANIIWVAPYYPNDWKIIYKIIHKRNILFWTSYEDYIYIKSGKISKAVLGNTSLRLQKINTKLYNNDIKDPTEAWTIKYLEQLNIKNPKKYIDSFLHKLNTNAQFSNLVDLIFKGLDINLGYTGFQRDIKLTKSKHDLSLQKLNYMLYLKTDTTLIREFRDAEDAELYITAIKSLLNIDVDINSIYTDIEEQIMDMSVFERMWSLSLQE